MSKTILSLKSSMHLSMAYLWAVIIGSMFSKETRYRSCSSTMSTNFNLPLYNSLKIRMQSSVIYLIYSSSSIYFGLSCDFWWVFLYFCIFFLLSSVDLVSWWGVSIFLLAGKEERIYEAMVWLYRMVRKLFLYYNSIVSLSYYK